MLSIQYRSLCNDQAISLSNIKQKHHKHDERTQKHNQKLTEATTVTWKKLLSKSQVYFHKGRLHLIQSKALAGKGKCQAYLFPQIHHSDRHQYHKSQPRRANVIEENMFEKHEIPLSFEMSLISSFCQGICWLVPKFLRKFSLLESTVQ